MTAGQKLPAEFTERMKRDLGDEFGAFISCYDSPRRRGLRVNTMKMTPEEFAERAPFPVKRIPWVDNGFFYPDDVMPAQHPWYAAGVYYLQEPSAMTPASRLPVREGDRVLDLCAAPGGKSTELAARLHGTGLLVSNDISVSRARALLRNLELFGAERMLVTAETPENLAGVFPGYFDRILVDAPCSGEGMFRKSPAVLEAWSPERTTECSRTQRQILQSAWEMLRPGGWMMYSTCTFTPEEDEQVIAWFLREHTDMVMQPIEPYDPGFRPGRPAWADGNPKLEKCVRIWPHVMEGEGHFLALMRKQTGERDTQAAGDRKQAEERYASVSENAKQLSCTEGSGKYTLAGEAGRRGVQRNNTAGYGEPEDKRTEDRKAAGKKGRDRSASGAQAGRKRGMAAERRAASAGSDDRQLLEDFLRGTEISAEEVVRYGDRAYLTQDLPDGVKRLNFLRNGLFVGEWKKGRFEPSQPLALALHQYPSMLNLSSEDERVKRYLRGETLQLDPETDGACSGWTLVCVDGFGLGWAKITGHVVKNRLSRSWMQN